MASPTNSFTAHAAIGIREDLADVIYRVDHDEVPFTAMAPKGTANNVYFEWQTDSLESASSSNRVIEGDDAALDSSVNTTRVGNYAQISDKTAVVTGTLEATKRAGRGSEMTRQRLIKAKSLRRDMETMLLDNVAQSAGSAVAARQTGGLPSWVKDNVSAAGDATESAGNGTDARTDGTARAMTEAQFQAVLLSMYNNGAKTNGLTVMLPPALKQKASVRLNGLGTITKQDRTEDKQLTASIDVYDSDFGKIKLIPNRLQQTSHVWFIDKEMVEIKFLPKRKFVSWPLAKNGDTEKWQILSEYGLCVRNGLGLGAIYDLNTSDPS